MAKRTAPGRCAGQPGWYRVAQVVHTEVALAGPFPADFDHAGALIDAGTAAQEFCRVKAGAAGRIEERFACR